MDLNEENEEAPREDGEMLSDVHSLSEFPSLSSAPAQHPQNSSQSTWANATQRNTTQTPVQRPQQQQNGGIPQAQHQGQSGHQQSQPQQENIFPGTSQFPGLDEFRFGGQDAIGQMPGSNQPKTGSIDDFPPLGRTENGEMGQARRSSLLQSSGFGAQSNTGGGPFGLGSNQPQNLPLRGGILSSIGNPGDGNRSTGINGGILSPATLGSGALSASRSPIESMRQAQGGQGDQDRSSLLRAGQNGNSGPSTFANAQGGQSHTASQGSSQGMFGLQQAQRQGQQPSQAFGTEFVESPQSSQPPDPLSSMSELDRFGLTGLLHMIRNEGSDIGSLAIGQDLTALGLDLNQPDPLYPTFASPFAEAGSRPAEPDFTVPACYTVQNVQTLTSKVPAFSDETLFYIFYAMPHDIMQEVVAAELTSRSWRYHKELKQWLTKDPNYEPQRINANEERGFYVFFDPGTWQRQRREFLLHYDSLDARNVQPVQGLS
ncbi:MAG: 54S ribosomal protein L4 mitochondrial [Chaenotheca gracillima]|nr:MAG: 54S ribosomal protein L4 mitochondrial [Chaenotheca gracillima]